MNIEVTAAGKEQEPILANLLELYAHDLSEFHDLEIGANGRFGYEHLPLYWSEPGRHPFLAWLDGKLAGLVLVKRVSEISGNETVWDISQNFLYFVDAAGVESEPASRTRCGGDFPARGRFG